MRRQIPTVVDEASFGSEHLDIAIDLNNLAQLLQATNRLEEAEPLMRRALAIAWKALCSGHPTVQVHQENLRYCFSDWARLLQRLKPRCLTVGTSQRRDRLLATVLAGIFLQARASTWRAMCRWISRASALARVSQPDSGFLASGRRRDARHERVRRAARPFPAAGPHWPRRRCRRRG